MKQYKTKDGHKVRVLATDMPGRYSTVIAIYYGAVEYEVKRIAPDDITKDFIEVGPWDDFKIDEIVLIKNSTQCDWKRAHFAGISSSGKPMYWYEGRTSWTNPDTSPAILADECVRPNE